MEEAKQRQASLTYLGEAGAGLVQVTLRGDFSVQKVHIDSSLLSEQKSAIEQMVTAAYTNAWEQAQQENEKNTFGDFNLPQDFKFPF